MAPADADYEARRQFGNVTAIRERTRDQWGGASIDMLIQDVRYGLRMVRKAPGFSAVAIASLAVGIGASTVLFSFANSALFRPVQAAHAEEIMEVFSGLLAWMRAEATLSGQDLGVSVDVCISIRHNDAYAYHFDP